MIEIHDDIFDKIFLLEISSWLMEQCKWDVGNVANRNTVPYKIEGTHRLLGTMMYDNPEGTEQKYWEHVFKPDHIHIEVLEKLWTMYRYIQKDSKNKCMLQLIEGNLQFKGMDGTIHADGNEHQTVFIMMLAYHDIDENMGGEFYHEPTGKKIPFKQGRVIEMTASDAHRADAFNVPHIPRFSIKFTGLNDEVSRIYNRKIISF